MATNDQGTPTWRGLLLIAAVVALTAAVFAPVRGYELVSVDDPIYVTDNPHLRGGLGWHAVAGAFTSTYANFWHPATLLSLMLDAAIFGVHPGALHTTNLLLHLGSTIVLFLALVRMTGASGRAALVAALFALHPLHVESVAWVSERKDVLSTFFWMLTLYAWAGYARTGSRRSYGLAMAWFAVGLMAKPMLVMLPCTLLLLDVWPLGRAAPVGGPGVGGRLKAWAPLLREKIPFFALAAASGVVAIVVQQRAGAVADLGSLPLWPRVANAVIACVTYVLKTIWPTGLMVFYPYPATVAAWSLGLSAALLVGVSVAAIRFLPRQPWLAVGWFWFLVTLLPVSGLVQVGSHAMADRYTYVPTIGLFLLAAWGAAALAGSGRTRRVVLVGVAAGTVAACAVSARAQVATWRDSITLWRHALAVMPGNYYAHNALGLVLTERSPAEAAEHFTAAARLMPNFPNADNNLGLLLAGQGKTADAIAHYEEALRRSPGFALAHVNMGNALLKLGRAEPAVEHFRAAVRSNPRSAVALAGLGNGLAALGRTGEAAEAFEEALRLEPSLADAHYNLGNTMRRLGRLDAALGHYREALRHGADSADVRNSLAVTLAGLGRTDEAVTALREAVRRFPASIEARTSLGNLLLAARQPEAAADEYREALRLSPESAEARTNLGTALFEMGRPVEALREHERAVQAAPRSADARFNLATTLLGLGRAGEAVAQFEATLAIDGGSADVHVGLGEALERLGRTREAEAHYREAVRLAPDSTAAAAGLARTTAGAGRRPR
jgi:protein O-mannosyl-transferase